MRPTSFAVKATLLASMVLSSQAFSQTLPDEINHPQYLKVYQNLETVLAQKTSAYEKLAAEKKEIETLIIQMEKDQVEIPARNAELQRIIQNKEQDLIRINNEIQGLEGVLGQIIEDLRRLDNMIIQLKNDLNQENARSRSIQMRRNQLQQVADQINIRLQREIREENQSIQVLNRLNGEIGTFAKNIQDEQRDRTQLVRDVERFKVEVGSTRINLNQNNAAINAKRPQLQNAQNKLPGVKAELKSAQDSLSQVDRVLTPKRNELNALKAELARVSPDIARLQNENKSLSQKISSNQTQINNSNITGQINKKNALESEVAGVKAQIKTQNSSIVALQMEMRPVENQINELTVKLREAQRRRDTPEVNRIKKEIETLSASISGKRMELARLEKEVERLAISIAPKLNEITQLEASIKRSEAQNATLTSEINAARSKIAQNETKISELSQSHAGLGEKIAALTNEVNTLERSRGPLAQKVASLDKEENLLSSQVSTLSNEIKRLENENQKLTARISEMEKTINEFPQTIRRMDAHIRAMTDKLNQSRSEADREERLLARIRQDRMSVETEMNRAVQSLNQATGELENSERLMGAIQNKINNETQNRETLTRYNQDSIRKLDNLRLEKAEANSEVVVANDEININNQDIQTITQELPRLRSDLGQVSPQVSVAESAMNSAHTNAVNAQAQYQNRLSLYQNYLAQSQGMGEEKAKIATVDGSKAGSIDAKTKAQKLAAENAGLEGKWEALRRGYVRGEIAGFKNGFDLGMNSTPDAQKGIDDGAVAGMARAKDHANMVVKPEIYLKELERRLKEDTTSNKIKMAGLVFQEISTIKSMSQKLNSLIPDLTMSEIQESNRIVSSLDKLITQADIEISEVLDLRKKLADAANVYLVPGAGVNAQKVDCSSVYKNVKDFVEACKGSYVLRYKDLYNSSHAESFKKDYSASFKSQIESVFESELSRLYSGYLSEASKVSKEVGLSAGKKEIYQQSFDRAESEAYGGSLPAEVTRVETEAVQLVQDHLNQNAALTLNGVARISTPSVYGIAPGVDADLKMMIKNIGGVASEGNSFVRILEMSPSLTSNRKEAPLNSVAPHAHADLSVISLKVSEKSHPGDRVILAGEVVHPGNHYRSNRVETFRIETALNENPGINTSVDFDKSPRVSVRIFGTIKKHDIDLSISPKYAGVRDGYEFVLEEVGSDYMEIVSRPGKTSALNQGEAKKVSFTYKLSKSARGKTVKMALKIKNGDNLVHLQEIEIKPE